MQESPSTSPRNRCLRPKAAAEYLGIGVSTLFKYAKTDPNFPKGIKMSSRCTLFREFELEEYLQRKAPSAVAA